MKRAIDFARLTRRLQEERVSVALDFFIKQRENLTTLIDLDSFVQADERKFLTKFSVRNTQNKTDNALQTIADWPTITDVAYLKDKLTFQIQHALFRAKIRDDDDDEKSRDDVFAWYNEVNSNTLKYVTYSIRDSDISNFYPFIIGRVGK